MSCAGAAAGPFVAVAGHTVAAGVHMFPVIVVAAGHMADPAAHTSHVVERPLGGPGVQARGAPTHREIQDQDRGARFAAIARFRAEVFAEHMPQTAGRPGLPVVCVRPAGQWPIQIV